MSKKISTKSIRILVLAFLMISVLSLVLLTFAKKEKITSTEFPVSKYINIYTDLFNDINKARTDQTNHYSLIMEDMNLVPVLDFDVSSLKGKKINSATLTMKMSAYGESLRQIDISTVSQQWARGATFYDAMSYENTNPWAGAQYGWFTGVYMSGGHSQYWRKTAAYNPSTGILTLDIPVQVVYSMMNGKSCGFALVDALSETYSDSNSGRIDKCIDLSSKNSKPRLTVEYAGHLNAKVPEIAGLKATAVPAKDWIYGPAVKLAWKTGGTFSEDMRYKIRYTANGTVMDVPEYMTPFMKSGKNTTTIYGLKENTKYKFSITATNKNGSSSASAAGSAVTKKEAKDKVPISRDAVKNYTKNSNSKDVYTVPGSFSVSITDTVTKINPVSGDPIIGSENAAEGLDNTSISGFAWKKGLYVAGEGVVLQAAKGERTSFQLDVKRLDKYTYKDTPAGFSVGVTGDLANAVQFSQTWARGYGSYGENGNGYYPDYLIPLSNTNEKFNIPFKLNNIENPFGSGDTRGTQKVMPIFVDVNILDSVAPGIHKSTIRIARGSKFIDIPLKINVADYTLPDRKFNFELNAYGFPPHMGNYSPDLLKDSKGQALIKSVEKEYYRAAYQNGSILNVVPYYQAGNTYLWNRPKIGKGKDGQMHVLDWTDWDNHYGPYLDGSYVKDIAGKNVPISGMYLPFSENWPMSIYDYYYYDNAYWSAVEAGKKPGSKVSQYQSYPENLNQQRMTQPKGGIGAGFLPGYKEGFKSILKDFIIHINEKIKAGKWSAKTSFQVFFNDKEFEFRNWGWNGGGVGKVESGERTQWLKWGGLWNFLTGKGTVTDQWLARYSQPSTSWWLLDEPYSRQDWEALAYFGSLVQQVKKEMGSIADPIKYRTDISRCYTMYDSMDGVMDIPVINRSFTDDSSNGWGGPGLKMAQQRKQDFGEDWWTYNGWQNATQSYVTNTEYILGAYARGSNGYLNYDNITPQAWYGDDAGYLYPDDKDGLVARTCNLISGKKFGLNTAFASVSLKAGNQASELTRYLDALKAEFGYTDKQINQYISAFININSEQTVQFTDGTSATYTPYESEMEALKRDILKKLTKR